MWIPVGSPCPAWEPTRCRGGGEQPCPAAAFHGATQRGGGATARACPGSPGRGSPRRPPEPRHRPKYPPQGARPSLGSAPSWTTRLPRRPLPRPGKGGPWAGCIRGGVRPKQFCSDISICGFFFGFGEFQVFFLRCVFFFARRRWWCLWQGRGWGRRDGTQRRRLLPAAKAATKFDCRWRPGQAVVFYAGQKTSGKSFGGPTYLPGGVEGF